MSGEPLRRSSRIKQLKEQTESRTDKLDQHQPRQSLRRAGRHKKDVLPLKQKARNEQQRPDSSHRQAKVKRVTSQKPSTSQAQRKDVVKQADVRTKRRFKQTEPPPGSQQIEQRPQGRERLEHPPPARDKPTQRFATVSGPKPTIKRTERPSSRLNRIALRQLQRETANDPLPEGIREVNIPFSQLSNFCPALFVPCSL